MALLPIPGAHGQSETCNGLPATQSGSLLYGTDADEVFVGTPGPDRIFAEGGSDTICSLGGRDQIAPGLGDDHIDGGGGVDTIVYWDGGTTPTTVNLVSGSATGAEGEDEIVVGSIENVEMNCSLDVADTLIGDDDDNLLNGGSGPDRIEGNGGDDTLIGTDTSYNRTDAICYFEYETDRDEMVGGDGDDVLLGQLSDDDLDGGAGYDIIDGDDGADDCLNGERYARCELRDPPPPPPECSDGIDNDSDENIDYPQDVGCSSLTNPTEVQIDDPNCNDGFDNNHRRGRDFPRDTGCWSLDDNIEFGCFFCLIEIVTLDHVPARARFRGMVEVTTSLECTQHRRIVVRRRTIDGSGVVARTRSREDGRWRVGGFAHVEGRYFAVAGRKVVTVRGEQVTCRRLRSETAILRS
ncbi:MAG: calcium-binding protein [Actinomycetota bacterium]